MCGRWLLALALAGFASLPGQGQEGSDKVSVEKDYVRIEVRGTLKIDPDAILVTATPTNFSDAQTWKLVFWRLPDLRKAAEKLGGKTVVLKGDLRFISGQIDKDGKVIMDNRPFRTAKGAWVIFATELKAADPPKEK